MINHDDYIRWPFLELPDDVWDALRKHLSDDLTHERKYLISDFINVCKAFERLDEKFPKLTLAEVKKELTNFRNLPDESIAEAYKHLSINTQSRVNYSLWLMLRERGKSYGNLHPSQYRCAAIVTLERLPKIQKGRTPNNFKPHLYHWVLRLWKDLGETSHKTYNGEYTDHLVSFTHTLLTYTYEKPDALDTIRKDLAKIIKEKS